MKSVQTLPEGSRLVLQLDLQKDKKTALKVNLLAVVILAAVVALGVGLEPLGSVFQAGSPPSTGGGWPCCWAALRPI